MKQLSLIIIIFLSYVNAQAGKVPFQLPSELMTSYGVIAPLCFSNFTDPSNKKNTLNLKTDPCLKHQQSYNDYALKNGLIGYALKGKRVSMKPPYIFYRYVGELNKNDQTEYIFMISWSDGGTGSFTKLMSMTLNNSVLTPKQIYASGDRCNGSVKDAVIRDKQLHYQTKITPFALYALHNSQIKPNLDSLLPDCAVCCIGTAHYVDRVLSGVQFNSQLLEGSTDEKTLSCFNEIAKQYTTPKKRLLNPTQIKAFQAEIKSKCLHN